MNLKRIFLSPPFVGAAERRAVAAAFASGYIAPCGPQLDAFEAELRRLSSRRYALALASGTAAIDLLVEVLGVDRRWTVVAPTLSFIATVAPAAHRGARIVLVDSESATGLMDLRLAESALAAAARTGRKTLLIGVDLFGHPCDSRALARMAKRHGAVFFLDAAESMGASLRGRGVGKGGFAAAFSFNGNKVVTASGGGALVTDSKALYLAAKKLANEGRERAAHYEHAVLGYNYGFSNILAAIGLAQLSRLPAILMRRRRTQAWYARQVAQLGLGALLVDADAYPNQGNAWMNVLVCPSARRRDRMLAALAAADVEARPCFKPLHLQPALRGARVVGGAVSEDLFRRALLLPSGTGLAAADLRRIRAALERAAK